MIHWVCQGLQILKVDVLYLPTSFALQSLMMKDCIRANQSIFSSLQIFVFILLFSTTIECRMFWGGHKSSITDESEVPSIYRLWVRITNEIFLMKSDMWKELFLSIIFMHNMYNHFDHYFSLTKVKRQWQWGYSGHFQTILLEELQRLHYLQIFLWFIQI